jgi:putative FmdB family regulatory protein
MPIYEYRCAECGFQDEFLQKHSDPLMTVCPSCGKESLKKLLSAAGFQLKGSGWYATDFKSSGAKPAAKAADAPKAESAASGEKSGADSTASEKSSADKPSGEKPAADKSGDKAAPAKTAPAGTSG